MMLAKIDYKDGVSRAALSNGELLESESATALATLLVAAGVQPDDATWHIWTLENKFRDIMKAVAKGDKTWARMAEFELGVRMST
jgi:hypothetical protein